METLNFLHNWNGKLNNQYFTTIRLRNDRKYFVGATMQVSIQVGNRQASKGLVKVEAVKNITLNQLDEFTAALDTGYSLKTTCDLIRKMYQNVQPAINWQTQHLQVVLLKKQTTENNTLGF
jgi:uncharacterized protein YqfB (UPF0267 family)